MPLPTSALEYPTTAQIAAWDVRLAGVRDGSTPTDSLEVDSSRSQMELLCDWDSRYDVAAWLLGKSQLWNDAGTVKLSRLMPRVHPERSGWGVTRVTEITGHKFLSCDETPLVEGLLPVHTYERARIKFLLEHLPYALREDADTADESERYLENPAEPPEVSGTYLQMPSAAFFYVAPDGSTLVGSALDKQPINANIGKIVPQEVFWVKLHRLPEEAVTEGSPWFERLYGTTEGGDQIPIFGTINTYEMFKRPSGTLLLMGVRRERKRSPLGTGFEYDVGLQLGYLPQGWNWIFGFSISNTAANGLYMVSASKQFNTAESVPDNDSIYNSRPLERVFQFG